MPVIPKTPFPSFTLALSRQATGDNENHIGMQERNGVNVEPPIDLMKTFDSRLSGYDRDTSADEDRSETETVFEERTVDTMAASKGGNSSRKRKGCLRNLTVIFRMLTCLTGDDPNENG